MEQDYIDRANRWFREHLTELLKDHRGKWVVVFNDASLGIYDTFSDAYKNGVEKAHSEKIVIREIKENPDVPTEISVNVTLGLIDAQPRTTNISQP